MNETFLPWLLLVGYAAVIVVLAWRNRRRADSIETFSVGSRRVPPFFIGLSLAANMTSVATFVINPGLIYAYGWSGVIGYGVAAPLGIFLGLVVTSKRFRRVGDRFTVLTVPQWLGERFGDRRLTAFFAAVSMLQVTFLVLIVTALVVHFGMYYGGVTQYHNNPAVPATVALAVSTLVMVVGVGVRRGNGAPMEEES